MFTYNLSDRYFVTPFRQGVKLFYPLCLIEVKAIQQPLA